MRKILSVLLFCSFLSFSQEKYEVEKLSSRIRMSGEIVGMQGEPDLGFIGHGYEMFGLVYKVPEWYFGVNSYSALTGIRSGLFVFGISTGIQKPLVKDWLFYDTGFFIGGGGGSGAADGGGLMIRPHVDLEAFVTKKISLRAGFSLVDFPSGAIHSFNFNVGATINMNTYLANSIKTLKQGTSTSFFNDIEINALSSNLFNYKKGPLKTDVTVNKNAPIISLIGATVKSGYHHNFYGILKLGGAFIGEVDGFMMLLSGVGYQLPITEWMSVDAKGLLGGAGGGNVQFGGGFATQIEAGIGFNFSDYLLNVSYGNTYAPNGNFKSNHLDISIGKKFKLYKNPEISSSEIVASSNLKKENFSFSTYNRAYFSENKKDKLGRVYDKVFNLIGFELEKKLNNSFSVIGATVWAYQGNYGAYAEGWLGLQYYYHLNDTWRVTAKGLLGAGGGGDIDLGSGMLYQYSLGVEKEINKRWSFITNLGQVRAVNGNFTPVLLDVGVKLNIHQLVKR
ncbi:hypothetical protein [Wenyingzhuangia sp. IMCC45467]